MPNDKIAIRVLTLVYFLSLLKNSMSLAAPKPRSWELGRATPKDEGILRGAIFRERMNPLFIDSKNFFVARSSNQVIGCGQIRPIGESCFELASLAVDDVNRGQGIGAAIVSEVGNSYRSLVFFEFALLIKTPLPFLSSWSQTR